MNYTYFPGCTSHSTAKEYDESTRAVCAHLGMALKELEDWNCCGATAIASQSHLASLAVPLRNLALAEAAGGGDIAVACNACFVALRKAQGAWEDPRFRPKLTEALAAGNRTYNGGARVRHLLDILLRDLGLAALKERVTRPLEGLKVAPYYGCQLVRPDAGFSSTEQPTELDDLLAALGAEPVRYDNKTRCCGGALITTKEPVALGLNEDLLAEAQDRGADCIAVACPMCQLNLEGYQGKINARFGRSYRMPVLFFTELMGLALGLAPQKLGMGRHLVSARPVLQRVGGVV